MTLQQQRRFARRLLKKIGHRRQAGDGAVNSDLRAREIERFLMSNAVQSAALHDIWADTYTAVQAEEWRAARQERPIFSYDYRRLRAPCRMVSETAQHLRLPKDMHVRQRGEDVASLSP